MTKRHDHRQSTWLICGGSIIWCYRCGAWRQNNAICSKWTRPVGLDGENPALRKLARKDKP